MQLKTEVEKYDPSAKADDNKYKVHLIKKILQVQHTSLHKDKNN